MIGMEEISWLMSFIVYYQVISREVFKVGQVSKIALFSWEHLSLGSVNKEEENCWTLTHSERSYQLHTSRLNVRIMKSMHNDKKRKIIWNFPKVT